MPDRYGELHDPNALPDLSDIIIWDDEDGKYEGTEMSRLVESYIKGLHCSTFGRAFDIASVDGRERCVQWLTYVIGEVVAQ